MTQKVVVGDDVKVEPEPEPPKEEKKLTIVDCKGCGYPIHVSNKFCPFCGAKVET